MLCDLEAEIQEPKRRCDCPYLSTTRGCKGSKITSSLKTESCASSLSSCRFKYLNSLYRNWPIVPKLVTASQCLNMWRSTELCRKTACPRKSRTTRWIHNLHNLSPFLGPVATPGGVNDCYDSMKFLTMTIEVTLFRSLSEEWGRGNDVWAHRRKILYCPQKVLQPGWSANDGIDLHWRLGQILPHFSVKGLVIPLGLTGQTSWNWEMRRPMKMTIRLRLYNMASFTISKLIYTMQTYRCHRVCIRRAHLWIIRCNSI